VAIKWHLNDEGPDTANARAILNAWADDRVALIEPALWAPEVVNVMGRAATIHKRITESDAKARIRSFLALDVRAFDMTSEIEVISDEAMRFNRSVYDMTYVVLAERKGIEIVTADEKVFGALAKEKPFVKLLRHYSLAPERGASS
jgi:predicted nucleic acid-binding protein